MCITALSPVPVRLALALSLATAAPLALAGTASVRYTQPERYTDAGHGAEAERVRGQLTRIFEALAQRWLPEGQSLELEVLDIDLAGEVFPRVSAPPDVRVLRGGADWPQITLRWVRKDGDRELARGEERIADMTYQLHGPMTTDRSGLPYEERMLDDWARARFGAGTKAAYNAK